MKLHDKFSNNILNFVDEHVSLEWHEMTRKVKNKLGLSWAWLIMSESGLLPQNLSQNGLPFSPIFVCTILHNINKTPLI